MNLVSQPSLNPDIRQAAEEYIDLANASIKFLLPRTGQLFIDPDLRGIDDGMELHLPFPFVALEFLQPAVHLSGAPAELKTVVFARQRDDDITISVVGQSVFDGQWRPAENCKLPRRISVTFNERGERTVPVIWSGNNKHGQRNRSEAIGAEAVYSFLNALACSNVQIERSPAKKGGNVKGALPFDDYHILTIGNQRASGGTGGGSHRSPREHLRRGHIRRLESGSKIWVNATVVNAGVGGKVTKDYRVQR